MKVILDIPQENLERLGVLAKYQKRSRKAFMELVLITHAETAEEGYPETQNKTNPTKSTETAQKSKQAEKRGEAPKKEEVSKIEEKTINADEIQLKIEELTKAANSCADTRIGRLTKISYLRQIKELESKLK
jgi:hypothetical protein